MRGESVFSGGTQRIGNKGKVRDGRLGEKKGVREGGSGNHPQIKKKLSTAESGREHGRTIQTVRGSVTSRHAI